MAGGKKKGKGKGKGKGARAKGPVGGTAAPRPMETGAEGAAAGAGAGAPSAAAQPPRGWRPGGDAMEEGQELTYDLASYHCLESFQLGWPALSLDVVRDGLGDRRDAFPHSLLLAAGTQADRADRNHLCAIGLLGMTQGRHRGKDRAPDGSDEEESSSESDSDDEDGGGASQPMRFRCKQVPHRGGVNRVRSMPQRPGVLASWSDAGVVQVWDLGNLYEEIAADASADRSHSVVRKIPPRHVSKHPAEGYALDWSPVEQAHLLAGDCQGQIQRCTPAPGGRWATEGQAYAGHGGSVEDLQWSPVETNVFASCSTDRTVKIWDSRQKAQAAITIPAHDADVNVISWNRLTPCMLASGGDDGAFKIWDLRSFQTEGHVANIQYHHGPVTSIEWCPHDSSMLATASADNQVAVWDLSLERDAEEEAQAMEEEGMRVKADELPPQLLFLHLGQTDPKEVRWHPQIPSLLVSTAANEFNVFKPANLAPAFA